MAERFASRFEAGLDALNAGLQRPRTEKRPAKVHKYLHNFSQELPSSGFQAAQFLLGICLHDFNHGEKDPQACQQRRISEFLFVPHLPPAKFDQKYPQFGGFLAVISGYRPYRDTGHADDQ